MPKRKRKCSRVTGCASDDSLAAWRKEVQGREGDPVVNPQVFLASCWIEAEDVV